MNPLRICMLTTGFPRFQGDLFGTFVLELARELVRGDVTVEILAPHAGGLPRHERFGAVDVRRFRYCWPASRQTVAYGGGIPTNLRKSWAARLQLPLFIAGFCWSALGRVRRAQVIHCHWTITGLVAYLATRLWRRPLVLSVRGSDIHLVDRGLGAALYRRIYGCMGAVVAVSEDIGSKLDEYGVPRDKIKVVPNGVDSRFQPGDRAAARREFDLPTQGRVVLFVGLLVPVKGLELLVEALSLLEGEKPLCLLVGSGPQQASLEQKAAELGLADCLRFVGRRSSDEIPRWMAAADLLVLPSLSEGRPNVVLEAQACGLPVVATRVGGTPELINDGETGLLVDSGDARSLALAIARLLADGDLRSALGRAGREQAQRLTWTANATQMIALYRQLLGVD